MDVVALAKVCGLASSGIFAGYTWALSHAAVPAILFAPDALAAREWRYQYLMGFHISRPMCVINGLSFGFLAYHAPGGSLLRYLYILAASASASGVPYALTFLRRTNGALSRKADRLAGPGGGEMALTYAFNEKRSIDRDGKMSTAEAIKRWQWHNYVRTWVLVLGTVAGALAVAMD
ncbi:hypothetical protein AYO21_00285 [Fonsecaea monophora]|uniref:DUF1772 domain-containing protein n=1 Tax=Fonsecaea monophora TaxID=254056 RepID=A0A177FR73_9EURO|nr:hypothetical protein AYO21_00285 [Fonsecaea monophora]OAG45649.1 hypothetical protein AYO21_00285 [Fonsecaea monophora]